MLTFIYLKYLYLYNFGLINNCRTLYKYDISHNMSGISSKHLSTAGDEELADDQLPAGHTPVWIEPPGGATQVQMLERVETMAGKYQDVMVLYWNKDERAAAWCRERGWRYHWAGKIYGCEAQCVVLLELFLYPEYITRGRNMLIIFSSRNRIIILKNQVNLIKS